MTFWLKKFVSFWLMPLPFCLVLLVIGVWLLRSASRRKGLGQFLVTAGVGLLLLFSNKFVSMKLLRPLEAIYPPIPEFSAGEALTPELAECHHVAVLGGGHGDAIGFSAVNQLSNSARARLAEGIRLWRALPGAKLVVSGGGEPGYPTHADVLAQAAISLGVDPARVIRLGTPRDTEEEAAALAGVVGEGRFALVTSAWHLRRATALMRQAGLNPLPCPADYVARPAARTNWQDYLWDVDSLGRSTWAIYERIGYAWSWLRGRV